MARNILFILAALVAQECSAVPVVLPTSIFPSLTLTGVPLPTGARLDVGHHHSFPFSLPPLPTGSAEVKREEDLALPTGLPSLSVPILSLTDITSLLPLPTGGAEVKREGDFLTLPTDLSSLSISLPSLTSIPTALPSLTSVPSLPTLSISVKDKRQEDPPATASVPIATATGLPTEVPTPPAFPSGGPTGIPTGIPTGVPTGVPTGLPPSPTGSRAVPGGLMRPGRA
ncbi:hypothetical protein N0V93_005133 [Gnomoniopsis smithogilvyi]|uniref:Uncharacterized protein n=1 Tax=Gnomoniopsis smithogilvyi TaxID=1191159 RepID=A0A9W8YU01_9PEZI|nr:hypothetical protein N0V93_005133 [Gnomoniopsis smithogilvyi]